MKVWGITDRGSVRKENQDAWAAGLLREDLALAVVCDGMGGALAGNVASTLAVQTFWDEVAAHCTNGWPADPQSVLTQAAALSNACVYRRSREDAGCRGMGTTLVAALCDGRQAWVVNVGDSRCYAAGQASIVQVSRDHSLVEMLVNRGEITREEARSHPNKNLITRALGVEAEVQADLFAVDCPADSFLLLCSDGLSNLVTSQELLYELIHGGAPEGCCQRLLELALGRGAPDNVTAVLLQL